ncbi:MAG: class A beta-lactamase-related serine hydrolase [Acidobacteria bacterium]|nr:class A beta-lactamase-related serine hydrolase [Acidobacteriota bacterium]
MASTYKVPIAVQLLARVDQGEVRLDQVVELKPSDIRPNGTIRSLLSKPGLTISVRNLLELVLLVGDNTAADVLLRMAGGPPAVTARMRALGIHDMDVSRPVINMLADSVGIQVPPESERTPELLDSLYETTTPETRAAARTKWEGDPRDTSTPDAMAALLVRIQRKDLLKPDSAELLLDGLRRNQDGDTRLKAMLPAGTMVAHKMGTLGRTTNDVGIITLPETAGHIAVAVFVKSSDNDGAERERAIAQIARAVYDYFLFQPSTSHTATRYSHLKWSDMTLL